MDRKEFMGQLERLLMDLPESDRMDAIAYYNDYFDEAGLENEASVIQELGNPGKVAGIIKADLRENGNEEAEYTENGYHDNRDDQQMQHPWVRRKEGYREPKQKSRMPIALIIIAIVFTSPLWIGAAGGIIGLLAGFFGVVVAVLAACGLGGGGLAIGGIVCIVVGIIQIFINPMMGCLILGIGFLLVALGMLGITLFIIIAFRALPKFLRWFVDMCQKLLQKGKGGIES